MQPYISRASCVNCGECVLTCPYEVFAESNGVVAVVTPEDCIECGSCMEHCEHEAISFDD